MLNSFGKQSSKRKIVIVSNEWSCFLKMEDPGEAVLLFKPSLLRFQ
jgi:hypothetical protein